MSVLAALVGRAGAQDATPADPSDEALVADDDEVIEIADKAPEEATPLAYSRSARDVSTTPGAMNDALRAITILPAAARIRSRSAASCCAACRRATRACSSTASRSRSRFWGNVADGAYEVSGRALAGGRTVAVSDVAGPILIDRTSPIAEASLLLVPCGASCPD